VTRHITITWRDYVTAKDGNTADVELNRLFLVLVTSSKLRLLSGIRFQVFA